MPRGLTGPVKTELAKSAFSAPVYCVRIRRNDGTFLRYAEREITFDDGGGSHAYSARLQSVDGFSFSADEAGPITITLANVDGTVTSLDHAESFAGGTCELIAYLPSLATYYIPWSGYCDEVTELTAESATLQANPVITNPHVGVPQRTVGIPCTHVFGQTANWTNAKDFEGSECPYQRVSTVGFKASLSGAIDDTVTSLVAHWGATEITGTAKFKKGHVLLIGTEKLLITNSPSDPDGSGNQTLTVTRGYQDTVPASHADTAPILFSNCFYDTVDCLRHGMYGNNPNDTYSGGTKTRNYFGGFPFIVGYQYGNYRSKSGERPKPLRLTFAGNETAYGRTLPLVYGRVRLADPILLIAKAEGDFLTTLWLVAEGLLATNSTDDSQTTPSDAYIKDSGVERIFVNGVSRHDPRPGYGIEVVNGDQDRSEPAAAFFPAGAGQIDDFINKNLGFWGTARVTFRINTKNNPSVDVTGQSVNGSMEIAYGRVVREYSDDVTFMRKATTSPAWVMLDIMTAKRAGGGIDFGRINIASFRDVASYCSQNITSTFDGSTVERWTFNGAIDSRQSLQEWIHRIAIGCYAIPPFLDANGKLKIKALKSETLSGLPFFSSKSSTVSSETYFLEVLSDAPSLYLRLAETVGTTATDSSGNGLNGTYQNTPTLGVTGLLTGDSNKAVSLNGTDEYITVADNALLDPGDVFTLEAWIQGFDTVAGSGHVVFSKGTNGYSLRINFTGGRWQLEGLKEGSGAIIIRSSIQIDPGATAHVAWVKNNADSFLYINGIDVSVPVTNQTIVATATDLNIGRRSSGVNYFSGTIDELAIYPTALSVERILQHYQAGKGVFQSTAVRNIIWNGDHSGLVKQRRPIAEIPNEIRVNYVDRSDYAKVSLTVADRDSQLALGVKLGDQSRRAITKSIDLPGTSTLDEAARIATLLLRAGEFGQGGLANNLKVTFQAFYRDAEDLEIGDVIEVEDDQLNAAEGEQYFRVTRISNSPMSLSDAGFVFTKEIEAVLHANEIYDDTAFTVSKFDRIDAPYPNDAEPPPVTSWGVGESGIYDTNNKLMTSLTFTWVDPSPKQNFKQIALYVTDDDGAGNPVENAWRYIGDLLLSGAAIKNFEITNTRKHFCAVSRALSGHAADVSTRLADNSFKYPRASVIVDGITDTLPAPSGSQIFVSANLVTLKWNAYSGNDRKLFQNFRVYRNTVDNFGSATLIAEPDSTLFIDMTVAAATVYYYFIVGYSVLNQEGTPTSSLSTTSATNAGADTGVPDAPTIGTVRSLGSFNPNEYSWLVGIDHPGGAANWSGVNTTDLQVATDSGFSSLIIDRQYAITPPFTTDVKVTNPGTYYFRARVKNSFGYSSYTSTLTRTTNLTDAGPDTALMDAPTVSMFKQSDSGHSHLAGNAFDLEWLIGSSQASSYWGYTIIVYTSSTLPTATTFDTGTAGSITSGSTVLTDATKAFTVNALVGKDVVIFSDKRTGSPTWDYEGVIYIARILSNTATTITFDMPAQRVTHTISALKYYVVNVGNHFYDKVSAHLVITNEGVTALTDSRSGTRRVTISAGSPTMYAWVALNNVWGHGKVTASPPTKTFDGITTGEIKLLAITTGLLADNAITTTKISDNSISTPKLIANSVTAAKIDVSDLFAQTITASGTITGATIKTAGSNGRVEMDPTNGLRCYNSGGSLKAQFSTSNGFLTTTAVKAIDSLGLGMANSAGTNLISIPDSTSGDIQIWLNSNQRFSIADSLVKILSINLTFTNGFGIASSSGGNSVAVTGSAVEIYQNSALALQVNSSEFYIQSGWTLRFGTHSAIGAETITGYITVKDAGGTSRKLAVVS